MPSLAGVSIFLSAILLYHSQRYVPRSNVSSRADMRFAQAQNSGADMRFEPE